MKTSTVLSHLATGAVATYALATYIHPHGGFARCTFGMFALYALIGIVHGVSENETIERVYNTAGDVQESFALPCIFSQLIINYEFRIELICINLMVSGWLFSKSDNDEIRIRTLLLHFALLGTFSAVNGNMFGILAAIVNLFSTMWKIKKIIFMGIPGEDLCNLTQALFIFLSLQAMSDYHLH